MNETVRYELEQVILSQISVLNSGIPADGESYDKIYNNVLKGCSTLESLEKQWSDSQYRMVALNKDIANHKDELDQVKKDRLQNLTLGLVGVAVPALITIWGTKITFEFEETGTITTMAGKALINKLFKR